MKAFKNVKIEFGLKGINLGTFKGRDLRNISRF